MPELLSPRVVIEEVASQQQQIQGVSTSTFATVGWTPRGPENVATLVTSINQFLTQFGEFNRYSDLHYGMVGFFNNGGTRAYVVRVTPSDAELAQGDLETAFRFFATSKGAWGNLVKVSVAGNANFYDIDTATYSRFDVNISEESVDGEGDFDIKETFEAVDLTDVNSANYILNVINAESTGSELVTVEAVSGGIPATLQSEQVTNESVGTGDGSTQVFTHTVANPPVALDTVKIRVAGTLVGIDDGEGNLQEVSGSGVTGTIDYEVGSMSIFFASAPSMSAAITVDYYKAPATSSAVDLTGGSDGTPSNIGRNQISAASLQVDKQGIFALDVIDEFLNFALMDFSAHAIISNDVLTWAEGRKDVFVVLDCGPGKTATQATRYKRNELANNSSYGAVYYPRIKVADELNDGRPKVVSPVGHIVGCYARTDIAKNVGKSPAGVNDGQLRGIIELEFKPNQAERDVLSQAGVNPLREDTIVGKAIWDTKTLALVGDFTEVNARRLFIFLEKSAFQSTHDFLFENIGPQLWAAIKLRFDGFYSVLFEDGYFRGDTPEQAFRIVVDESNNPQSVINAKQVIVDIFIAVNEPAKFLRLRHQRQFPTT